MATQVTVNGTIKDAEGNALEGSVSFAPTEPMYDGDGQRVIGTAPVVATLSSGAFSLTLFATDDPNTTPEYVTYTVTEAITGSNPRSYRVELHAADTTVRYEDLVPFGDVEFSHLEQFATDGDLPSGWVDASTLAGQSDWWDALEVLDEYVVIPSPDDGAILQDTNSGGRAAAYKDWGGGYDRDVRVDAWWSGDYPLEGTPLICVNPDVSEFGIGVWPANNVPPFGSVYLFGTVGRKPSEFDVTATSVELADHVDGTRRKFSFVLSSDGTTVDFYVDDELIFEDQPIPANLQGSTSHGVAIDTNQTDGNSGNGGTRTPYAKAIGGPFRVSRL